jgi:Uma2 family endonuclease
MEPYLALEPLHGKYGPYTYKDWLAWPEGYYEILNGTFYLIKGQPTLHQEVMGRLLCTFANYRKKGLYGVLHMIGVIFPIPGKSDEEITDIALPDITIYHKDKIRELGCYGTPEVIIEILSPYTAAKDCILKKALYEKKLLPEYWIVDPENKEFFVFLLTGEIYNQPIIYTKNHKIKAGVIPELEIDLKEIFEI